MPCGDGDLVVVAFGAVVAEGEQVEAAAFEFRFDGLGAEEAASAGGEGGGAEEDGAAERFAAGNFGRVGWAGHGDRDGLSKAGSNV